MCLPIPDSNKWETNAIPSYQLWGVPFQREGTHIWISQHNTIAKTLQQPIWKAYPNGLFTVSHKHNLERGAFAHVDQYSPANLKHFMCVCVRR